MGVDWARLLECCAPPEASGSVIKRADCARSYPGLLPMPPEPSERLAAARFRVGAGTEGHQGRRLGSLGVLRAARGLGLSD